jgi:hypothetical protein
VPGLFVGRDFDEAQAGRWSALRDPDLGEAPIRSLSEGRVVAVVNAARVYVELGFATMNRGCPCTLLFRVADRPMQLPTDFCALIGCACKAGGAGCIGCNFGQTNSTTASRMLPSFDLNPGVPVRSAVSTRG